MHKSSVDLIYLFKDFLWKFSCILDTSNRISLYECWGTKPYSLQICYAILKVKIMLMKDCWNRLKHHPSLNIRIQAWKAAVDRGVCLSLKTWLGKSWTNSVSICNPWAILTGREREPGDSLEAHEPGHHNRKKDILSQRRWKSRTDSRHCLLNWTRTQVHIHACLWAYAQAHTSHSALDKHIEYQNTSKLPTEWSQKFKHFGHKYISRWHYTVESLEGNVNFSNFINKAEVMRIITPFLISSNIF